MSNHLHSSPNEPVCIEAALEPYWSGFSKLPRGVQANTYWWRDRETDFVRITYDYSLRRATATALKRRAGAHELVHILAEHEGYFWVLWKDGARQLDYLPAPDPRQEYECEYGAAYLLVPATALTQLKNESQWYIARTLDVPEHLVELRWTLLRQYGS